MKIRSSFALVASLLLATAAAQPVVGHTTQAPARASIASASALHLDEIHAMTGAPVRAMAAQMPACSGCHGPTLPVPQ